MRHLRRQNKQVQVEVDGTVVETLTVNTNGRRVVQLALNAAGARARVADFPVDGNPGAPLLDAGLRSRSRSSSTRWETQETNPGLPGWFYSALRATSR